MRHTRHICFVFPGLAGFGPVVRGCLLLLLLLAFSFLSRGAVFSTRGSLFSRPAVFLPADTTQPGQNISSPQNIQVGQNIPSGQNILSKWKNNLKARKDTAQNLIQHTASIDTVRKTNARNGNAPTGLAAPVGPADSLSNRKGSRRFAATDTVPPEPEILVPSLDRKSCKSVTLLPMPREFEKLPAFKAPPPPVKQVPPPPPKHIPFLQVHGNVLYNVNYYSRIDTPYNERDIYQHTIQTYLDILVKGQYPMRVYLTNRFSNSPLFRNFSDFNLSYNNSRFSQSVKDEVLRRYLASLPSSKALDSLRDLLNKDLQKLHGLSSGAKDAGLIQRMVEAREAALHPHAAGGGSAPDKSGLLDSVSTLRNKLTIDSLKGRLTAGLLKNGATEDSLYLRKKQEEDSLRKEIGRIQELLQTASQSSRANVSQVGMEIQKAENPGQLRKKMEDLGMSDSTLPKGYKTLMAVRSLSLGRSVVNFSELSAKNISINGVQAEYNPSAYYAVAAGSVDYRFRDFIVQGPGQVHQYLDVLRYGRGSKDGNSVILTYFQGKRQLYNAATSDSLQVQVPSTELMGLTLEGNYRIDKHVLLTGEIGKSSTPSYAGDSLHKAGATSGMLQFNNRTNEAYALKMSANFPETNTRIRAGYKHLGVNYQSFSIFTDGSAQTAWNASIDQLFFKRQLDIMLGANTNDFSNPFVGQEYKSTTVFKSIQATLRKRKWPVISMGYFPSSQLSKLGNGQYIENLFYTMVGNISHSYSYQHVLMNTALVYTRFYNHPGDSGFVYFNTQNLLLSHSIFLDKFSFLVNASGATNPDYQLYTLEGRVRHTISRILTAGVGIKYNKQTTYNIEQMGYSAEATLQIPRLGQIQFSADKGFVPGMNNRLVTNNTGRLSYFKTF